MKDFLDGLENDDLGASKPLATAAELRANAHITNGGEKAMTACIKCGGSGQTRWGPCFRCEGKGRISVRSAAASKAVVTREENARIAHRDWCQSPVGKWCLENQEWNDFARKMIDVSIQWGKLSDGQTAAIERSMAKQAERRAAKAAAPKQEVDVSRILAMFETAKASGLKRLGFRALDIEIKAAAPGRNEGTLWVTANGEFQGGVKGGKFNPTFNCSETTKRRLTEVAADPLGQAKLFGVQTGKCSCCGRELTDPVSIANGIGPICEEKWGL